MSSEYLFLFLSFGTFCVSDYLLMGLRYAGGRSV